MVRNILPTLLFLLALPGFAAPAQQGASASLTIEPQETLRRFDAALLGVNDSWPGLTGMWEADGFLRQPFPAVGGTVAERAYPPLFRMAGRDSQFLDWKKTPGFGGGGVAACRQRILEPTMPQTGLLSWLASIRKQHPDARYIWTVNMAKGTPDDARDLAEFLSGGPDTLWGKLRIDLGFPDPMPPAIWELGDELDYHFSNFSSGTAYARECRRYISAIRSVIPEARFAVHAVTAPWENRSKGKFPEFNRLLLDALAEEIDFLSFHPYLCDLPPAVAEPYFESLAREIAGSRNPAIRLLVTEPALPLPDFAGKSPEQQRRTLSLAGCLEEAEWFLFLLGRPEVDAATLFNLPPGPRGMSAREKGFTFETGLAQLYWFLRKIPSGSQTIRCTLSGDAAVFNREQTLCAAALKSPDENELYLLFNNLSPDTARPITFRFFRDQEWVQESAVCLTAPELTSFNTATEHPIAETVLPVTPGQPLQKLTIPPKSLVLVTLARPAKEGTK